MDCVTRLMDGAAVGVDDTVIVKAFDAACAQARGEGASKWTAGIRNDAGAIYRGCVLYGLDSIIEFGSAMEDLGYQDELSDRDGKPKGLDAIFRKAMTTAR